MSAAPSTIENAGAQTLAFDLFGYRFAVETDDPQAAERFATLYSGRGACPSALRVDRYQLRRYGAGPDRQEWSIRLPEDAKRGAQTLESALRTVEETICAAVVRNKNGLLGIHGAVVYGQHGDLLISGISGAGKSTLSLALTVRGMRVGGDDAALLDPSTDLVEPIPRCFHLDERSLQMLSDEGLPFPPERAKQQFFTPADLSSAAPAPARIRFVFLLEPERGETPIATPQTQAEMAAALLMETGRGHFSDADGVLALTRLVGGARCYRLRSGALAPTASLVARLCGAPN